MKRIGVFDSGLGGLTVLDEICKYNNGLDIVYFGDTARVPYGSRTRETIIHYAIQDVSFLQSLNVEGIVVACGTVSANAMNELKDRFQLPILGVIEAAVSDALQTTGNGRIGVIGTEATIRSGAYQRQLAELSSHAQVSAVACPLLVPMIENGLTEQDPVVTEMAARYLMPLKQFGADTIIMGCTHYPFYQAAFEKILPDVHFVHMGTALSRRLPERLPLVLSERPSRVTYYVSDGDTGFLSVANRYLHAIHADHVREINIEEY